MHHGTHDGPWFHDVIPTMIFVEELSSRFDIINVSHIFETKKKKEIFADFMFLRFYSKTQTVQPKLLNCAYTWKCRTIVQEQTRIVKGYRVPKKRQYYTDS